jgi:transposase-like protein
MTTTKRWTTVEASEALAAWERSGETLAAFARRLGVSAERLAWWRRRLARTTMAPLVPMVVRAPRAWSSVRVTLEGCEVEVGELSEASAAWVASLVRALGEGR